MEVIQKEGNVYIPTDKIYSYKCEQTMQDFDEKYERLLNAYIKFAKEHFNKDISKEIAENTLIAFLKKYDLDVLFIIKDRSLSLPKVSLEKHSLILFSKFIDYIDDKDSEYLKILVDIAVGHSLSNFLNYEDTYREVSKSSLQNLNLYLDTKFILRFLGAEGVVLKNMYQQLVDDFINEGINLFIFNHTYEEIDNILQSCLDMIDNRVYDPRKASLTLRFFKEQGYKQSDVQLFINKIEDIFKKHNICIVGGPDPNIGIEFQIDEDKLFDLIVERYGYTETYVEWKRDTIHRDVQSISYIYKLRDAIKPHNIHEGKNVFVTTNSKLALISKEFEKTIYGSGNYFPITSTDVFIGTLIWVRRPEKMVEVSKKRLLSTVYALIEPTEDLFLKYLNEIERLKRDNEISQDDFILLRDSHTAKKLLTDQTLGDLDAFTPKTPLEILEEIKEKAMEELLKEKEEHNKTIELYEKEKQNIEIELQGKLKKERQEHERIKAKYEEDKVRIKREQNRKIQKERKEFEKERIKVENDKKVITEKHDKELQKERSEHEKTKDRLRKVDARVEYIAKWISGIIILLFVIIMVASYFVLNGFIQNLAYAISILFIILSILGITIKQIKIKFKEIIKKGIGFE